MKINKKVSLWLTSIGLGFLFISLILCVSRCFRLSLGPIGGVYTASLFTLMFGGSWSGSRLSGVTMAPSIYLIIAFSLMILALFIFIFIIYGITCDNINYKHRLIIGGIALIFLIASNVIIFFIKDYVATAFIKVNEGFNKEYVLNHTEVLASTYVIISFIFVSIVCYIAAMINSIIAKKVDK